MKKLILIPVVLGLSACAQKTVVSPPSVPAGAEALPVFMTRPQPTIPVELVFDSRNNGHKPLHYRKNEALRTSGSATFSPAALRDVARPVKKERALLYVFDLRQESHGLVNDKPVTWHSDRDWANADLNHDEAVRRERRLLADLRVGDKIGNVEIKSIETEESMIRSGGAHYIRLTVTDHVRPVDSEVDRFIEQVRALPENAWVHFHCRSGKGRTTTFMALYDMLRNAKNVSFDEIIRRNVELSDDHVVMAEVPPEDWKYIYRKEHAEFVREFYNYAKAHPDGADELWSQWVRK